MPINPEKSVQVWALLPREKYNQLKDLADKEKRSISKQAAYIIERYLDTQSNSKNKTGLKPM